jgi:hypothetical protein
MTGEERIRYILVFLGASYLAGEGDAARFPAVTYLLRAEPYGHCY